MNKKIMLGTTVGASIVFMMIGIIFWGGFNTAMEATNTLTFCISCHEMEDNVYQEYKLTVHYKNRHGIRVTCSDCHVPKSWMHKFVRKIQASNELMYAIIGSIDTQKKFNEKRFELANHVWNSMKENDSRECKNCHSYEAMNLNSQQSRSSLVHKHSQSRGKTCIDCHKGIAHKLPDDVEIYRGGNDDDHEYYEKMELACFKCHEDMQATNTEDWDLSE